ncbi:hypothetical protein C8Q76DRAFT_690328 [Earliella scabrosa]|nr:hypothetical protein C8Q76DRAFT_690328 [Earliella scabrosa]
MPTVAGSYSSTPASVLVDNAAQFSLVSTKFAIVLGRNWITASGACITSLIVYHVLPRTRLLHRPPVPPGVVCGRLQMILPLGDHMNILCEDASMVHLTAVCLQHGVPSSDSRVAMQAQLLLHIVSGQSTTPFCHEWYTECRVTAGEYEDAQSLQQDLAAALLPRLQTTMAQIRSKPPDGMLNDAAELIEELDSLPMDALLYVADAHGLLLNGESQTSLLSLLLCDAYHVATQPEKRQGRLRCRLKQHAHNLLKAKATAHARQNKDKERWKARQDRRLKEDLAYIQSICQAWPQSLVI